MVELTHYVSPSVGNSCSAAGKQKTEKTPSVHFIDPQIDILRSLSLTFVLPLSP